MELSFCLIGEDSLLIQCGNILLENKHSIQLVISSLRTVQDWAKNYKIPYLHRVEDIFVQSEPHFDYILSIVNNHILSQPLLKMAKYFAINYHDSLLPKYAGLNATSWVIINGELEHGITWHIMDDGIDTGDILVQEKFLIKHSDTALNLNLRCYEYAIHSFRKMLHLIESNNLILKKQSNEKRSYFSANHLLPSLGIIDWENMPAGLIERLSRGLDLGSYQNNVGSLKLLIDDEFLIVGRVELVENNNQQNLKGKVVSINKNNKSIGVNALGGRVYLSQFTLPNGNLLSIEEFLERYKVKEGCFLKSLKNNSLIELSEYSIYAKKGESYWVNCFNEVTEHSIFSANSIRKQKKFQKLKYNINLKSLFPSKELKNKKALFLSSILIYLFRLNNLDPITVSIICPKYKQIKKEHASLFLSFLPLNFSAPVNSSLKDIVNIVQNELVKQEKNPYIFSDFLARKLINHNKYEHSTSIIVNFNDGNKDVYSTFNKNQCLIFFDINLFSGTMNIYHRISLDTDKTGLSSIIYYSVEHLLNIIYNLVNNPQLNATNFSFLPNGERSNILRWGSGKNSFIPSKTISSLIEEQAKEQANKIAIYFQNRSITYGQLNNIANSVAAYIQSKGILPKTIIGIYSSRNIELISIILGILKAGCVYLPLDTRYPILKIEQIFEDSQLDFAFIENKYISMFFDFFNKKRKTFLNIEDSLIHQAKKFIPFDDYSENLLAYIMFTSGTTGRPKGIMVSHKNVLNYCKWFSSTTNFSDKSIIDFSSSIAFDLSIPCTIAPLIAGGSIAIADSLQKANPKKYLNHLLKHKITHIELTPGYLELLLSYPDEIKKLKTLYYILLGADIVPANDVMQWLSLCPEHQIVNEYGPTETTVSVISYFVDKDEISGMHDVPIGRPGFNTTCYVLDKNKNLCPMGMKGELYIGGAQVSQGYLNREELTKQKFVYANFIQPNEKIYKSGDIVSWLPNGQMQFWGRNDHQVKIQGYRVELSAIESFLVKHPDIDQAAVIVMNMHTKDSYLKAFLVSKKILSLPDLKEYLLAFIPHYMIPKEFCKIAFIPLKENEKIDFAALENMSGEPLSNEDSNIITTSSLNPIEKIIKKVWENAFHKRLSLEDNFFDFGGDSLMAMQIATDLQKYFKATIPLHLLFENPTISKLAEKIPQLKDDIHVGTLNKTVVLLERGIHSVPLFLVHPVGGSVFWYLKLSSLLSGNYTVYGIQDLSLVSGTFQFQSLEEMAAFYIAEIEKVYQGQNFYLGGASFGSTVAYEMTVQLQKKGKQVKFLGLFDGWAHYPKDLMLNNSLEWLNFKESFTLEKEKMEELIKLEEQRKNILLNYKLPKVASVNAILFKAKELWPSFQPIENEYNGWDFYIQEGLSVRMVPGNHETMFFSPHVEKLASLLLEELACPETTKRELVAASDFSLYDHI